jgi:hypothetical protein
VDCAHTQGQKTVKFINDEASSIHGNLNVASVYTSESGEWKLGGFEVLSSIKDDEAIIYVGQVNPGTLLVQGVLMVLDVRERRARLGTLHAA